MAVGEGRGSGGFKYHVVSRLGTEGSGIDEKAGGEAESAVDDILIA